MVKPTSTRGCIIGCCIPLTQHDFFEWFENFENSDFLRSQFPSFCHTKKELVWLDIYELFSNRITKELRQVEHLGTKVIWKMKLSDLALIEPYEVFTLFGHYSQFLDSVEMFDGLHHKVEFARKLPNFWGIIDLTVCNSDSLCTEVRKKLPNQVISFGVEVGLLTNMIIYNQLIINLERYEINYIDCFVKILIDFKIKYDEKFGKNVNGLS